LLSWFSFIAIIYFSLSSVDMRYFRFPMTQGLLAKAGLLAREDLSAIGGSLVAREGNFLAKECSGGVEQGQ
jgi:hypothetical protein